MRLGFLVCALLAVVIAAAGGKSTASKEADQREAESGLVSTCVSNVEITLSLPEVQGEMKLRSWYKSPAFTRIQGRIDLAEGEITFEITLTADRNRATELLTAPFIKQYMTYDLVELRRRGIELAQAYNPVGLKRRLLAAGADLTPKPDILGGREAMVYTGTSKTPLLMAPVPGLPVQVPGISRWKVWTNASDGLPRKASFYNAEGEVFWTMTFSDLRVNVPVPNQMFELKPPDDAVIVDGTQLLLESFAAEKNAE